jgi:RimJ/RimL family protein N-acetyltransferase
VNDGAARDIELADIPTDRLILRQWRDDDRPRFAALNGDPETMRFYASTLSRDESDAYADRSRSHLAQHGWGLWAVEHDGHFIGYTGLSTPSWVTPFETAGDHPVVEIGWRYLKSAWGNGYATEAAKAALKVGFEQVGLDEIVSFTAVSNQPSWRVMERIGMTRNPADDFEHPNLPEGHPLSRHVLYRTRRN